jgi:hypothetical protein
VKLVPVNGNPFEDERQMRYKNLVPVKGNPFADVQPEDPGVLGAIGLGFGRMSDKLLQGGKQAVLTAAEALGNKSAAGELSRMAETEQLRDEGYAPLQEQRPFATMAGESLPLLALPMGGSLKASAAISALPGLLEYGSAEQRLARGAAGAAGGGIGHGIGKALGAVASPGMKAVSPEAARLAEVAKREGIPLDAAQITNNPVLQNTKAALGKIPWTSTGQAVKAQQQQEAYVGAVLRKMGAEGKAATPDVMGDAYARIGGNIGGAAEGVSIKMDDAVVDGLAKIEKQYLRRLPTDQKAVVQSYMEDLTALVGREMPGDVYQATRSELGKLAFETENNTVKHSVKQMQKVLDDAFDRQAPKEAVKQMHKAREEYGVYATTADALKRGRNQDGMPSPKQMYAAKQASTPGFERGAGGDFAELVRAGRQFLPETIPNSGTPQQSAFMNLLTAGSMGGLGALGGSASGNPEMGAAMGLAGFGLSKGAQGLINSPQFTRYLMTQVLTEEQKRMLAQLGGSAGLLTASQGN